MVENGRAEGRALGWLLLAVSLAFAWILLPYYGTILWGGIIALLFRPVFKRLMRQLRGRRTLAALLTMGLALLIAVLPAALVAASLVREAGRVYERLQTGELEPARILRRLFDALPPWLDALLDRFGLVDFDVVQRKLTLALTQASQAIATQTFSVGQDAFGLVVSLFIALYLAFFLIRDGDTVVRAIRRALPLAPAHQQELIGKFGTVLRATVKGNLVVALVQGALGGLAFWYLDVGGALLWAVLMALLSLLPAIGAGLVWAPVALWLYLSGQTWAALGLVAYGVLVIGLVDNLLRPLLVGRDTGMPDYLVLISTIGGMTVLGINGFVIGPTIAAMFIAAWQIQASQRADAA